MEKAEFLSDQDGQSHAGVLLSVVDVRRLEVRPEIVQEPNGKGNLPMKAVTRQQPVQSQKTYCILSCEVY